MTRTWITSRRSRGAGMVAHMFFLACIVLACGDSKAASTLPSATPIATADGVVDAIVGAIAKDQAVASQLLAGFAIASLGPKDVPSTFTEFTANARAACDDLKTPGLARSREARDLWPAAYERLHSEVAGACQLINLDAGLSVQSLWATAALVSRPKLEAAQKALPDYSRAQLRRAIADRR